MASRIGCTARTGVKCLSEHAARSTPHARPNSTLESSEAGPSETLPKSHIFNNPPVTTSTPSRRMQRREEHLENVRKNRTAEEKLEWSKWMADPWFRLSKTPLRECFVTRRTIPNGFLINFRVAKLQPGQPGQSEQPEGSDGDERKHFSRPELHLVPDRVLHTKYTPRKAGKGYWTVLHHQIVERLSQRGPHQGQLARRKLAVSPVLVEMVRAQLGRRIIQEIEILQKKIRGATLRPGQRLKVGSAEALEVPKPILRRLTQEEARMVKEGRYEGEEAIAFLDLSKRAPRSSRPMGVGSGSEEESAAESTTEAPSSPVDAEDLPISENVTTPTRTIPLYHISRIFDEDALDEFTRIATNTVHQEWIEKTRARKAQELLEAKQEGSALPAASPAHEGKARQKPSNILVLASYPTTPASIRKGDMGVELAIALWRLRCYEGAGWEEFWADRMGRRV